MNSFRQRKSGGDPAELQSVFCDVYRKEAVKEALMRLGSLWPTPLLYFLVVTVRRPASSTCSLKNLTPSCLYVCDQSFNR